MRKWQIPVRAIKRADDANRLRAMLLRLAAVVLALVVGGLFFLALSLALAVFSLIRLCQGYSLLNWKIITFSVFFMGGCILTALGVLGEYVGKILLETKARPRYIVSEILHED